MSCSVAYHRYRRVFERPLRTAWGEWSVREGFIVRVETANGVGYGEVAPIEHFGSESIAEAEVFLRAKVVQPDLAVPDGLPCCAFGLSAARMMAGTSGASEGAVSLPVSGLLPAGEAAIDAAGKKVAEGFKHFKWKVGVESVAVEQAIFRELDRVLPQGVRLRLDANGGWSLVELESWAEYVQDFDERLDYFEQPLPVGQESAMAAVAESSGVAVALDESLQGANLGHWARAWSGPMVVKPALLGDVEMLAEELAAVKSAVVLSSVFETRVGVLNALQLARSLDVVAPIGYDTGDVFGDDLGFALRSGHLEVSLQDLCWSEDVWNLLDGPLS